MEQPRAHDPKKNTKTRPVALNIGAGSFGVGGILLLGGALVATTIVSVLAFKRRKQHQSASGNISPSDDVTSIKEMETKTFQNLTTGKKHNYGIGNEEELDSGDSNEDDIYSMVSEGQEDTSVYVDSVLENREIDENYEKVTFECEERVVIKAEIKEDLCSEIDDGGEEQKYSTTINDEIDEISDATLLVTDKTISSIEDYEAIEVPFRDDVAKKSEKEEEEEDYRKLKEDNLSSQLLQYTEKKVEKQVSIKEDMLLPHEQLIKETKVDDETVKIDDIVFIKLVNEEKEDATAVQVGAEMNTEDELVKKERISNEDEVPSVKLIDKDVKVMSNKSSDELEGSCMTTENNIWRILGRGPNNSDQNVIIKGDKGTKSFSKKQVLVSESWNFKLMTWSLLVSIWCLCHWYFELPYPQLSIVGSLFFVLILLGYRNRTTYLI